MSWRNGHRLLLFILRDDCDCMVWSASVTVIGSMIAPPGIVCLLASNVTGWAPAPMLAAPVAVETARLANHVSHL